MRKGDHWLYPRVGRIGLIPIGSVESCKRMQLLCAMTRPNVVLEDDGDFGLNNFEMIV